MDILKITIVVLSFFGILLHQYSDYDRQNSQRKIFCVICCIALTFFSAFRGIDVVSDTDTYIREFNLMSQYDFVSILKNFPSCFGYYFLNKIFLSIGVDVRVWFLVVALFFNIAIFKYIYEYSDSPLLSFILYISTGVFIFSLSGMKQIIAMGFCVFSYMYYEKKQNYVVPIILILIAATFHQSALFFIAILFITKLKPCKINNVIFIIFIAVTVISGSTFLKRFILYLAAIGNRFGHYANDLSDINLTAFYIQLLILVICFVYFWAVKEENNGGIIYAIMICLSTFYLTTVVSSLFRIGYYSRYTNSGLWSVMQTRLVQR